MCVDDNRVALVHCKGRARESSVGTDGVPDEAIRRKLRIDDVEVENALRGEDGWEQRERRKPKGGGQHCVVRRRLTPWDSEPPG